MILLLKISKLLKTSSACYLSIDDEFFPFIVSQYPFLHLKTCRRWMCPWLETLSVTALMEE